MYSVVILDTQCFIGTIPNDRMMVDPLLNLTCEWAALWDKKIYKFYKGFDASTSSTSFRSRF